MKVGPVFFLVMAALPLRLVAQRQASLGAGIGIVRYAEGSSFSAFTASPALQRTTPWSYLGATGSLSLLAGGVWANQGRADIWAALSRSPTISTRAALSAAIAASGRSDGVAAGSATVLIEALRDGFAVGAGLVSGVIQQQPGITAFRVRGRGWWQYRTATQLSLTTEATRFLGAWYTDVIAGASYEGGRALGSVWLSGRFSTTYVSTGAASVSLQYFLTPSLAVEASGGSYLRDPFQGLPRAGYIAGGVRVFRTRRVLTSPPPPAAPPSAPVPALQPLVAQHRGGDTVVVRFHMPGARQLAIAGNWNAWTPAPMQAVADEIWEAALLLQPGTYYFNLVVDGREWVVPGGVATIPDGMGGLIAVLNVL